MLKVQVYEFTTAFKSRRVKSAVYLSQERCEFQAQYSVPELGHPSSSVFNNRVTATPFI